MFLEPSLPHITIEHGSILILEQQNGHDEDITKCVNHELEMEPFELAEDIKAEICQRSSGIILWAVLDTKLLIKGV